MLVNTPNIPILSPVYWDYVGVVVVGPDVIGMEIRQMCAAISVGLVSPPRCSCVYLREKPPNVNAKRFRQVEFRRTINCVRRRTESISLSVSSNVFDFERTQWTSRLISMKAMLTFRDKSIWVCMCLNLALNPSRVWLLGTEDLSRFWCW